MMGIVLLLRIGVWSGNGEELDKEGGVVVLISAFGCRGGPSLDEKQKMELAEDPSAKMLALPCLGLSGVALIGAVGIGMGKEERGGAVT